MSQLCIGLDLSLTGSACVVLDEFGEVKEFGRWGYSLPRKAPARDQMERLAYVVTQIVRCIKGVMKKGDKLCVGIENYAFGARGAQNSLGELQGCVKLQLWLAFGVVFDSVVASAARKNVLGKGRFSKGPKGKQEIVDAVGERYGFRAPSHDVADAYVVARQVFSRKQGEKDD